MSEQATSVGGCMRGTALLVLLTGCLQATSTANLADARRGVIAPIATSRLVEPASVRAYSENFWDAVADLDVTASRQAARTEPESHFAEGVAALIAGDELRAETAFSEMSSEQSDPNIAAAAQLMFAATLLYEHKWSALSAFTTAAQERNASPPDISGMEKWGAAFAGIDSQVIGFSRQAVSIPLRVTAVGTPTISVRIGRKDYQFWLDTGSSMTVLSSDVAAEIGARILSDDTLTVATFAGVAPARPAVVSRMELGSIVV